MRYDFQRRIGWLIALVTAIGIFIPDLDFSYGIAPNPLGIMAAIVALGLGILYALRSIWAEPDGRSPGNGGREAVVILAFVLMFIQVRFLKNEQVMRRHGPWHADMLWPSGCVLTCIVIFGVLTSKRLSALELSARVANPDSGNSLSFREAEERAAGWIAAHTNDQAVLLSDRTIAKPYGWVFFYQSRAYLEKHDVREVLSGNAPLIVDRFSGTIHITGTALPLESYLAEYEAGLHKARFMAS